MQKKEYYNIFNSGGNDVWLDPLFILFNSFDENIISYDLDGASGTNDGTDFYDHVTAIGELPTMHSFHKDLPDGSYLAGHQGYVLCGGKEVLVIIYGVGNPLASADSAIIIQQKDREKFESAYPLCNPWV